MKYFVVLLFVLLSTHAIAQGLVSPQKVSGIIVSANTQNNRNNLLQSLGFNLADDVKLTDSVANSFVIPPQIKA